MPKTDKQKQKKQMKKRRKDKARKQSSGSTGPNSQVGLIKASRKFPVVDCFINSNWKSDEEVGINNSSSLVRIVITREAPDGLLVWGSFLVDMLLLGVKDAHAMAEITPNQLKEALDHVYPDGPYEPCDLALAHQIIYQGIDYAAKYDITPHSDFKLARNVLDKRGTHPEEHELTFGRDGKPIFVQGPYDNVDLIMSKLERTAGEGNYDYILIAGGDFDDDIEIYDDDDTN